MYVKRLEIHEPCGFWVGWGLIDPSPVKETAGHRKQISLKPVYTPWNKNGYVEVVHDNYLFGFRISCHPKSGPYHPRNHDFSEGNKLKKGMGMRRKHGFASSGIVWHRLWSHGVDTEHLDATSTLLGSRLILSIKGSLGWRTGWRTGTPRLLWVIHLENQVKTRWIFRDLWDCYRD